MIVRRTDSGDPDFQKLVADLDGYLAVMDGDEHACYAQYNGLDSIRNTVVVYENDEPVGCGAFKPYKDVTVEIKRMFVRPDFRGRKLGQLILNELERWANELGYAYSILETGRRQVAAVKLYQNSGYEVIPNYDQYAGLEDSVCMRKPLRANESVTA